MGERSFSVVLRRTAASVDLSLFVLPLLPASVAWLASMGLLPLLREAMMLGAYAFFFAIAFTKMRGVMLGDAEFAGSVSYSAGIGMGIRFLAVLALPLGLAYGLELGPEVQRNWLIYPLIMFWLPAAALIVGTTDRLLAALNPADLLRIIGAMGTHYWLMLALATLLIWAGFHLGRWILGGSGTLDIAVLSYCQMLGVSAALTLLGATAFTRREKLGINPAFDANLEPVGAPPETAAEHEFIRLARMRERDEGVEAAARYLAKEVESLYAPLEVLLYLLDLEIRAQRPERVRHLGARIVQQCLQENRSDVALNCAQQCLDSDPEFAIGELDADDRLIALALNRGRYPLAIALCENFIRNFPRYRRSVDMSVTAANLLIERYGQGAKARSILIDAIARGADEDHRDQIREVMIKLDSSGPGKES